MLTMGNVSVGFDRTYGAVARLIEQITAVLTGLLVVIVTANVFARYVLQIGMTWAEEVTILFFVWVVFLGAYVAYRRRAHLAITFVVDRLPAGARKAAIVLATTLIGLFLVIVVWSGFDLVERTFAFGRLTAMLGISAAWGYLAVPVSGCLILAETLRQVAKGDLFEDSAMAGEREAGS